VVSSGGRYSARPAGFEGFLPSDEAPESADLAAPHQEVDGEWLVEVNLASVPSESRASQPHNRVTQVANLALLHVKHLPGLPSRSKRASDLVAASV
jgi:hypothetical protein